MATQNVAHCVAMHDVGQLVLAVNNNGTFATGFTQATPADCFTGRAIPAGGGEYPKGSGVQYVFAASFWVGAVVGRDTLVSQGADGWEGLQEMYPDVSPFGDMKKRSIIDPSAPEYDGAISEQDYIAVYSDTFRTLSDADESGRPHIPLHIEVTQNSYSWSYSYAEDLVLFDYQIRNIGNQRLRNVYMGIYVDADVTGTDGQGFDDDICGFKPVQNRKYGPCIFPDTVYIAWIADNDGDFEGGAVEAKPAPHVTATRIVRTPAETLNVSFNWWISNGASALDFGPRERPVLGGDPFRDFGTGGTGTPVGDRNRYYTLRNQEFDYDQIYTASISSSDEVWLAPPPSLASDFADGYDTRYLLSFGPFDISVGQTLPLSFSYLAGAEFHTDQSNAQQNLPDNPEAYYENLDFSDLGLNATWADWIYDNPGVDTDGDGYRGRARLVGTDSLGQVVCDTGGWPAGPGDKGLLQENDFDTVWYKGDGVPDFRGASPPPAPQFELAPSLGQIKVVFNGLRSETTKDNFANAVDFEGYRVYVGRDNRSTSYSLLTSYDLEDYNRYRWDTVRAEWNLSETPFTLEQLRDLYGAEFEPLYWTPTRPWVVSEGEADIQYYFTMQDYNASDLTLADGISKVYPDAPYPSTLIPAEADPSELTPSGRLKYFEYQYVVDDLLPTVPYYINVTAFDYGSPASGLPSLETAVSVGAQCAYPQPSLAEVEAQDLQVFVYPNPYRIDGTYRELGFEGRDDVTRPDNRVREVHFANLPAKATIRIYTMDGDLVKEIQHDNPGGCENGCHNSWDLITRNTQMVVSGLYYWTVEDDKGDVQIGKLAIIM